MLSLTDLQTPDQRTFRFLPLGLGTAHKLRPESAAEFQQKAVDVALGEAVPEQVHDSFDRVRMLHSYGVLSYELFTAAHDLTRLILEQALRARFMEYYDGTIPLVAKDGAPFPLAGTTFDVVYDALNRGTHRKARRLVLGDGPHTIDFNGSLNHLLAWARAHRLLAGQRNRMLEPVLVDMRNDVAHPTHDHLVMPVQSAQAIRDLGEIINRLWGATTAGGRLYPAPIRRAVLSSVGATTASRSSGCMRNSSRNPDTQASSATRRSCCYRRPRISGSSTRGARRPSTRANMGTRQARRRSGVGSVRAAQPDEVNISIGCS